MNGSLLPLVALYKTILLMALVGDMFRWRPAFDGLHMLLGYATTSFDNTEEGRLLVQHAKGSPGIPPKTVRASRFRAAIGSQPPGQGIWVGALWGISPGANPGNDRGPFAPTLLQIHEMILGNLD